MTSETVSRRKDNVTGSFCCFTCWYTDKFGIRPKKHGDEKWKHKPHWPYSKQQGKRTTEFTDW